MAKRGSQSASTWHLWNTPSSTSYNMENEKLSEPEVKNTGSRSNSEEDAAVQRTVSLTDVLPFCDQLEKFIKYIRNVGDLDYLTYEYPSVLENRLNTNVHELESMLGEVKDALVKIEQLKMQRKMIKREKSAVKKTLKRMRDDEVREMESVISLYDKTMFARWEQAKTTNKPEVLEGIISDIKGKRLALDNLNILVTRKLGQIRVFLPTIDNNTVEDSGAKVTTVIPLPFPPFVASLNEPAKSNVMGSNSETTGIPLPPPIPPLSSLPPPLPPPPNLAHLSKRTHSQRLSIQRRRRLERREDNVERRCVVTGNTDDFPLIPFPLNDISYNLVSNLYPTILSTSSSSNYDVASASSISSTVVRNATNGISSSNNSINNSGPRNGLGSEFQTEMRTVLQALFGDLRTRPALLSTDSTSSNVAAENVEKTDKEIELHTLRKPQ